ncbi:MAG: NAD(+) synthase, partial [Solirubrobacterales bacterium]|nr:NAD(+) synthase [Solirubrobacterales bacterium]
SPANLAEPLADLDEVYAALVCGLADYAHKNGFERAVLGLSGGIDSALVALIAADALGAEQVNCVVMPSPHSSSGTQADARMIAANLGANLIEFDIAPLMKAYEGVLSEPFAGTEPDIAEENLQSRIRGNLIMALSKKFGWLALSTGNKSEMAVGYATLYGDMAGGFAVIKDVPKLLVFQLVENRNARAGRGLIPASAIERPPSAELRPDQLDTDSLPPYEELDAALAAYVEQDGSRENMIVAGVSADLADRVAGLVNRAEYKRRQAPPGVKITTKAFGRDRRLPMTNRFSG